MTWPSADEFASISESAPLVAELRARIERNGPIRFRDFMDAALYHPQHGYYRTDASMTGRGGDYVTSPEVHPVFGALVAKQLHELWTLMKRPARFDIVEQGAGRGLLARDIVERASTADPAFGASVRYKIVEPAEILRNIQQRTLAATDRANDVEWLDALPNAIEGCVLSNELVDAFPVHRVVREGDVLREVFVGHDGARFHDVLMPLSDPALAAYFDAAGVLPGDGCYAEVNLDAPRWIGDVARALRRGYVLTFDYGYEASDLYAPWRRDGTLACYYKQSVGSDPYQRIGKQDITSSVDFTALRRAGEATALATIAMTDQSSFLVRLGIGDGVAAAGPERGGEMEEYFARRGVLLALVDPGKLGRIKVLLQGRGVGDDVPAGFRNDA